MALASDLHIDSVQLPPTIEPQPQFEYVPPQDVRHTFELSPLYTLEQDRTPLRDDQFIGVDWYSTGESTLPQATGLMTVVVINNVDVIQRAKKMCPWIDCDRL